MYSGTVAIHLLHQFVILLSGIMSWEAMIFGSEAGAFCLGAFFLWSPVSKNSTSYKSPVVRHFTDGDPAR